MPCLGEKGNFPMLQVSHLRCKHQKAMLAYVNFVLPSSTLSSQRTVLRTSSSAHRPGARLQTANTALLPSSRSEPELSSCAYYGLYVLDIVDAD